MDPAWNYSKNKSDLRREAMVRALHAPGLSRYCCCTHRTGWIPLWRVIRGSQVPSLWLAWGQPTARSPRSQPGSPCLPSPSSSNTVSHQSQSCHCLQRLLKSLVTGFRVFPPFSSDQQPIVSAVNISCAVLRWGTATPLCRAHGSKPDCQYCCCCFFVCLSLLPVSSRSAAASSISVYICQSNFFFLSLSPPSLLPGCLASCIQLVHLWFHSQWLPSPALPPPIPLQPGPIGFTLAAPGARYRTTAGLAKLGVVDENGIFRQQKKKHNGTELIQRRPSASGSGSGSSIGGRQQWTLPLGSHMTRVAGGSSFAGGKAGSSFQPLHTTPVSLRLHSWQWAISATSSIINPTCVSTAPAAENCLITSEW